MLLLMLAVLAFALARLSTTIWLSIWLDAGDGKYHERVHNASLVSDNFNETDTDYPGK
jgi:hypothetical protein